jgi:hypothetical protein
VRLDREPPSGFDLGGGLLAVVGRGQATAQAGGAWLSGPPSLA